MTSKGKLAVNIPHFAQTVSYASLTCLSELIRFSVIPLKDSNPPVYSKPSKPHEFKRKAGGEYSAFRPSLARRRLAYRN